MRVYPALPDLRAALRSLDNGIQEAHILGQEDVALTLEAAEVLRAALASPATGEGLAGKALYEVAAARQWAEVCAFLNVQADSSAAEVIGVIEEYREKLRAAVEGLAELSKAATPGPWVQSWFVDGPQYAHMSGPWKDARRAEEVRLVRAIGPKGLHIAVARDSWGEGPGNAAFIAAAANAIRSVLALLDVSEHEGG